MLYSLKHFEEEDRICQWSRNDHALIFVKLDLYFPNINLYLFECETQRIYVITQ